jgi:hypothetical protein
MASLATPLSKRQTTLSFVGLTVVFFFIGSARLRGGIFRIPPDPGFDLLAQARPIWRFLLFLEDWKMGHVLQVNNSMLHHWHQGDVVVWQPGTMHVSANIGLETKWTCNITGFLNE